MMNAKPKILILRTAGTNCDQELAHAFQVAGGEPELLHISDLIQGRRSIHDFHILGFPGGFSFGDDVAAGRIHGIEVRTYMNEALQEFIAAGKLIIGICNGFQVLTNTGLLPGGEATQKEISLAANASNRFECRWVHMRGSSSKCVWFPDDQVIAVPVAHMEGNLVPRNDQVLQTLRDQDQIAFRYVDEHGEPGPYPINPNGSCDDIAGICDPSGRVLGLMPHPERHILPQAHPAWTRRASVSEGDGVAVFRNGIEFVKKEL